MEFLKVSAVSKIKSGQVALSEISFVQNQFQKIAIAGETGSGKTTLLKIIAGLEQTDAGTVYFQGERILGPEEKLIAGHHQIGYVSQHFELRNNYTVEEELAYKNVLSAKAANTIFDVCRIKHLLKRKTNELSGGERQRIVTARVLIASPKLLLLDEPFSNLDKGSKEMMKAVVNDIADLLKITCILVSHEPADTLSWADLIIIMKDGRIIQQGSPQELYYRPVNEYAASLLGKYNLISVVNVLSFLSLPGVDLRGKNMLIRPESFIITAQGKNTIQGEVTAINFHGNYFEIIIHVATHIKIIVQSGAHFLSVGDTVFLTLANNAVSFID